MPRHRIHRQWAFGQVAPSSAPEIQDSQPVEMQGEETKIDWDINLTHSSYNPMGNYLAPSPQVTPAAEKEQLVYDPLPRYLIDQELQPATPPTTKAASPETLASEALSKQSSASSSSSSSEDEGERAETAQVEQVDIEYLEQMQSEYKGTESTRDDMRGVLEVYHTTPDGQMEEDQLLRGEAMDASPEQSPPCWHQPRHANSGRVPVDA